MIREPKTIHYYDSLPRIYHNWDYDLRGSHLWGGPNSDVERVEYYSKRIPEW